MKLINQLLYSKKSIFAFICVFLSINNFAQNKYFEVVLKKTDIGNYSYGQILPVGGAKNYPVAFQGKTKSQLYQMIKDYLKARPLLLLKEAYTTQDLITYRDFSYICDSSKSVADLIGKTYIYAMPEDNIIKFSVAKGSVIYSTLFHAKLQITQDDNVASIGDAPFNEYKYAQPKTEEILTSKSNFFLGNVNKKKKIYMNLAYPECIYDSEGKLINPIIKNYVEQYYNQFVTDIIAFASTYKY